MMSDQTNGVREVLRKHSVRLHDSAVQGLASAGDQSVTCTCAATPPTMPTYRDHHLADCPVAVFEQGVQAGRSATIAAINRRYLELNPEAVNDRGQSR